jgi:DUF1680 family protein
VGNFTRTLLMLPTWTYSKDAAGVYVNLFIGSRVNVGAVAGAKVEIVQSTDYPWTGKVGLTVNPDRPATFTLRLRVPDRSVSHLYTSVPDANGMLSVAVNGIPMQPAIENGYAILHRMWNAGDKVNLLLPMKVQRVKAIERVASDRERVALKYGPLVFNVESVDQNINNILKPEAELTTAFRPDLLGGTIIIQGTFSDGSPLLAIPNYLRLNRGGRSIVWIRDR